MATKLLSLAVVVNAHNQTVDLTQSEVNPFIQQIDNCASLRDLVDNSDFPVVIKTRGFGNVVGSEAFARYAREQNGQFRLINTECDELEIHYGHDQLLFFAYGPSHRAITYHGDGSYEDIINWLTGVSSATIQDNRGLVYFNL